MKYLKLFEALTIEQMESIENLHLMAESLNIKRCWFHRDHYDIPKKRIIKIEEEDEVTPVAD